MAERSENGIDWELEMELARRGYTHEDNLDEAIMQIQHLGSPELTENIRIKAHSRARSVGGGGSRISKENTSGNYERERKGSLSSKVASGSSRPTQSVRPTAWKSLAVPAQTDYKCSDAPTSSNSKASSLSAQMGSKNKQGTSTSKSSTESTKGDSVITIAIILPSGKRITHKFLKSDSLNLLKSFVERSKEAPATFKIEINAPRRTLKLDPTPAKPRVQTFEEAGIVTNEALYLVEPTKTASRPSKSPVSKPTMGSGQCSQNNGKRATPKKTPSRSTPSRGRVTTLRDSSSRGGG